MKTFMTLVFTAMASLTMAKGNAMIDSLKSCLQAKDTGKTIEWINRYPEVLNQRDENGSSGFMLIAYAGMEAAFDHAKTLKTSPGFHEAIISGREDIVKDSIKSEPGIVNEHSPDGFTPLALAAFFDQTELAEFLLIKGADPNLRATNPSKVNALHSAVARENLELCKHLIEHGAEVNAIQMQGVTPLHSAVHRGNLPLIRLLVEKGADIHMKMENGDTALSIARKEGHREVEHYLVKVAGGQ